MYVFTVHIHTIISFSYYQLDILSYEFYKIFRIYLKKYLPNEKFCDRIIFVSGDGGMADALDSGSSGSSSCEGSSPFLRIE